MDIGNFSVPSNPNRLSKLMEHAKKIYDTYHADTIVKANKNDTLAQLLGYKSSNNGAFWAELAALKAYGLLEGRSDLKITDLAKLVTYGTGEQKPKAILEAFMNIPLWKQLYDRYRLQLPSEEFWAKLQHITGCEAPVAKSNEQFITAAFREDASLIKSVKENKPEDTELTPPDQELSGSEQLPKTTQFIEVKAGPYYQRLPFTEQGKLIAVNFLNALEIELKKTKKEG